MLLIMDWQYSLATFPLNHYSHCSPASISNTIYVHYILSCHNIALLFNSEAETFANKK